MCDISTYKNRIHDFAERLDPFIFSNEGVEHAEIVLSEIFEHAKDQVYIFCGHLDEKLTSRSLYYNSLMAYLASGKTLKVLIGDLPEVKSPALLRIFEKIQENKKINADYNNIECRLLKDSSGINSHFKFNEARNIHFTVSDRRSFRLETEPKEYRAFCSFNDVDISNKLSSLFSTYFEMAEPIN